MGFVSPTTLCSECKKCCSSALARLTNVLKEKADKNKNPKRLGIQSNTQHPVLPEVPGDSLSAGEHWVVRDSGTTLRVRTHFCLIRSCLKKTETSFKMFPKASEHVEVWTPKGHITTLLVSWAAKFQEETFNVRLAQTLSRPLRDWLVVGQWQCVQTDKSLGKGS